MPRKRSSSCWTCKLRRKRCDEVQPACRACVTLGIPCEYSIIKPAWMDDGDQQYAKAQQLKTLVKEKAHQRRRQRAVTRGQGTLQDADPPNDDPGPSPERLPGRGHKSRNSTPSSDVTVTTRAVSTVPSAAASTQIPVLPLTAEHEQEFGLIMGYLDLVFPLLFPFYQPSILDGGRGWLLSVISLSDVARQAAQGIASLVFSIVPAQPYPDTGGDPSSPLVPIPQTCARHAENEVRRRTALAISQLRGRLQELGTSSMVQDLLQNVSLLNSMVQVLIFENLAAVHGDHGWQMHLEAALVWFGKMLQEPDPYQISKWGAILEGVSTASSESAPNKFPRWNSDQAALRFHTACLVIYDIVASTSLARPPRLLAHFGTLLSSPSAASLDPLDQVSQADLDTEYSLDLTDINGCQNWVMCIVGEIAALSAWKSTSSSASRRSVNDINSPGAAAEVTTITFPATRHELNRRGQVLQNRLRRGLMQLDNQEKMQCQGHRDEDTANRGQYWFYLGGPHREITLASAQITRLWAWAALAYLGTIMLPTDQVVYEAMVLESTQHAIDMLLEMTTIGTSPITPMSSSTLSSYTAAYSMPSSFPITMPMVRVQAWPICIVGCLTRSETNRSVLRSILQKKMGRLVELGSMARVIKILDLAWERIPGSTAVADEVAKPNSTEGFTPAVGVASSCTSSARSVHSSSFPEDHSISLILHECLQSALLA